MTNVRKFTLLPSYYDAAMVLPEDKRKDFLTAICIYGWTGEEPSFDEPTMQGMFELVKPTIDSSVAFFEVKSEAGKQGGRGNVKQTKTEESKIKQSKSKEKQNKTEESKIKQTKTEKSREKAKENKTKRDISLSPSLSLSLSQNGDRGVGEGVDDPPPKEPPKPVVKSTKDFNRDIVQQAADECNVYYNFAKVCCLRLINWCQTSHKTYDDYYPMLIQFILTDRNYEQEIKPPPSPPIRTPEPIIAPPPKTEEELAAMRAMMPPFIANKKSPYIGEKKKE